MTKPVTLALLQWSSGAQDAGAVAGPGWNLLGATCIGGTKHESFADGVPVQCVAAPLLGESHMLVGEAWRSAGNCRTGEREGIRYRADDEVLFGVLEISEEAFPQIALQTSLQCASEEAYRRIFRLLEEEAYPHLWRIWNYIADINSETYGLERYRQFNIGRHNAFMAHGRLASGSIPAASALGVREGALTIAFMAARSAAVPLENPRQVNAWNYPQQYGPRSPTFARGALARLPGQELLFVSGTASIAGHRTVHPGDVAAQTREAMTNIAAVLEEANGVTHGLPFALDDLTYRVYIRHAEDFEVVRETLASLLGTAVSAVYVHADICRADLLVEIEATTVQVVGNG